MGNTKDSFFCFDCDGPVACGLVANAVNLHCPVCVKCSRITGGYAAEDRELVEQLRAAGVKNDRLKDVVQALKDLLEKKNYVLTIRDLQEKLVDCVASLDRTVEVVPGMLRELGMEGSEDGDEEWLRIGRERANAARNLLTSLGITCSKQESSGIDEPKDDNDRAVPAAS